MKSSFLDSGHSATLKEKAVKYIRTILFAIDDGSNILVPSFRPSARSSVSPSVNFPCPLFISLKGYCTVFQHALKSLEIDNWYCFILNNFQKCKKKIPKGKK